MDGSRRSSGGAPGRDPVDYYDDQEDEEKPVAASQRNDEDEKAEPTLWIDGVTI